MDDPVLKEDEIRFSKSLEGESVKEQTDSNDFKSAVDEESTSVQHDKNETNDDKLSSSLPVNTTPTKNQSDKPIMLLPETPDFNEINKILESKMQSVNLEEERHDRSKFIFYLIYLLFLGF